MAQVLFLDMDGVLNSDPFIDAAWRASGLSVQAFRDEPWRHIDPTAVVRLNRVVAVTGCRVVLSSDWRRTPRNPGVVGTQAALDRHGATFRIDGATPVGITDVERIRMCERWGLGRAAQYATHRWMECQVWLDAHPDVTHWIAVDDSADFDGWPSTRLCLTSDEVGLTDADADRLIHMLGDG